MLKFPGITGRIAKLYINQDTLSVRIDLHKKYSVNQYGWHNWVFDQFAFGENMKVLELGCGTGDIWIGREKQIPQNTKIILSDISPLMSGKAKDNLENNENFTFELFDIRKIPYNENEFDIVIANHILYHVTNPETALTEVSRVLKPGGVFYASTLGENSLKELTDIYRKHEKKVKFYYAKDISFSLDNGETLLKNHFSKIEKRLYIDSLEVTSAENLMDYILSYNDIPKNIQKKILGEIKNEIEKKGSFKIQKQQGMFVCTK